METFFLDAIRASYPGPDPSDPVEESKSPGAALKPKPIQVERMVLPVSLEIDETAAEDEDAHPVTVTLRHLTEEEATPTQKLSNLRDGLFRSSLVGDDTENMLQRSEKRQGVTEEIVRCKYVVGCDGAHSWARKTLGKEFEMHGEMTDYIW